MFSSADYKTAIAVMRAHSCEDMADGFLMFQQNAEQREAYTEALGEFAESLDQSASSLSNGQRLIDKLVSDGWKRPQKAWAW